MLNLRAQIEFGLPPRKALEAVTWLPAKAYALDQDLGTLEPGKLADPYRRRRPAQRGESSSRHLALWTGKPHR
jgi:alpha-D-ribose 1-methylphosphonate 5-triphosphate diphosphatase PhnM